MPSASYCKCEKTRVDNVWSRDLPTMFHMREVPIRSCQSENLVMGGIYKTIPSEVGSLHQIRRVAAWEMVQQNDKIPWQETLMLKQWQKWERAQGTSIYWMHWLHWIQLNALNTLRSSWVFLCFVSILWSPQILKETLPLAALRPDILKISAALAAIDHRLANLGRYHRRWPWGQLLWVKCCWCCDLLCSRYDMFGAYHMSTYYVTCQSKLTSR